MKAVLPRSPKVPLKPHFMLYSSPHDLKGFPGAAALPLQPLPRSAILRKEIEAAHRRSYPKAGLPK